MTGAINVTEVVVCAGLMVGVSNHHGERSAGGAALEHTGEELDLVGLVALGDQAALAWPPTVEIALHVCFGDGQSGWASIEHDTDSGPMRFTECRESEQLTERAGHGGSVPPGAMAHPAAYPFGMDARPNSDAPLILRVWIDQDLCTGDGLCTDHAPDVFTILEDGIAYCREGDRTFNDPGGSTEMAIVAKHREKDVVHAAADCPGECIFVEIEELSGELIPAPRESNGRSAK